MGPDEYAYPVNNSAYTNTVVKIALAFAVEAAAVLGETAPPEWAAVAAGLIVPFEPEAGSRIPESVVRKPLPGLQTNHRCNNVV